MATRPASRRRRFLLRASLVVAATLVALVLAETLCRAIFGSRGARWDVAAGLRRDQPEPDAILGMRMAPNAPGHDARGFRNAAAPVQADLVAIGDSHTWGTNARIDEAWPQVIGRSLGRTTYNSRSAATVRSSTRRSRRRPHAAPVRDRRRALRRERSLGRLRPRLERGPIPRSAEDGSGDDLANDTVGPGHRRHAPAERLRRPMAVARLHATSRSPGLPLRPASSRTAATSRARPRPRLARGVPAGRVHLRDRGREHGSHDFLPLPALDLSEPRIAEGLRLTCDALARIQPVARRRRPSPGRFIPTKESVYYAAVKSVRPDPDPGYERVVAAESRVSGDLDAFCRDRGIAFHDLLPVLREALRGGTPLYPATSDGHPLPAGYALYASSLAAELRRRGW